MTAAKVWKLQRSKDDTLAVFPSLHMYSPFLLFSLLASMGFGEVRDEQVKRVQGNEGMKVVLVDRSLLSPEAKAGPGQDFLEL